MRSELLTLLICIFAWLKSFSGWSYEVTVYGWPQQIASVLTPDKAWATHPILGTLVCPSLTELDLLAKKSAPRLLENIRIEQRQSNTEIWHLRLNREIRWWSGDAVNTHQLAEFVNSTFHGVQKNLHKFNQSIPPYTLTALDRTLEISWKAKPPIGPFIFNNYPFFRSRANPDPQSSKTTFECTGPFEVVPNQGGYSLIAVHNSKDLPQKVTVTRSPAPEGAKSGLEFRFAQSFKNEIADHEPFQAFPCNRPIDFPLFSGVFWNSQKPETSDSTLRIALTAALPRGALLRSASGHLGDLVSAPLLKAHPGYHPSAKVPDFNPDEVERTLAPRGYKRDELTRLLTKAQKTFNLTIKMDSSPSTLKQILLDAWMQAGVDVTFVEDDQKHHAHGEVIGFSTPWPDGSLTNLIESLHLDSKTQNRLLTMSHEYDISMTHAAPDFQLLQKLHYQLSKIEPISMIMQHRACLVSKSDRAIKPVIIRNNDWFVKLINEERTNF